MKSPQICPHIKLFVQQCFTLVFACEVSQRCSCLVNQLLIFSPVLFTFDVCVFASDNVCRLLFLHHSCKNCVLSTKKKRYFSKTSLICCCCLHQNLDSHISLNGIEHEIRALLPNSVYLSVTWTSI